MECLHCCCHWKGRGVLGKDSSGHGHHHNHSYMAWPTWSTYMLESICTIGILGRFKNPSLNRQVDLHPQTPFRCLDGMYVNHFYVYNTLAALHSHYSMNGLPSLSPPKSPSDSAILTCLPNSLLFDLCQLVNENTTVPFASASAHLPPISGL
jgi:hypothetical protein